MNEKMLQVSQYDEDSLIIATPSGATMISLEEFADSYSDGPTTPPNWVMNVQLNGYTKQIAIIL
jgi:hypothetical protein